MNNLLIPTSYLPPIGYMALLSNTMNATVEVCETFQKQTHRNRCEILTSNGKMRLSVPVVRTNGNHTLTKDIGISYAERWNIQHIRAIESAYNNAPYFMYLWDDLKEILLMRHEKLIDLNQEVINYLFSKLSITCQMQYSEEYGSGQQAADDGKWLDMRGMFANRSEAENNRCKPYYQVWNDRYEFHPNLSVIDMLFNIGPKESMEYLKVLANTQDS